MRGMMDFLYIRDAAERYGNFWVAAELHRFVQEATPAQLRELEEAYNAIRHAEDSGPISEWIDRCWQNRAEIPHKEFEFSQRLGQLLVLFRVLGENRISPFSSFEVCHMEPHQEPNWSNLPQALAYLQEPAEKYGVFSTESDVIQFLGQATPYDFDALARVAEQVQLNDHNALVTEWLNRFPMDEHKEASLVAWLFAMLDHAGMQWE
jgi:hypothetical protein